LAGAGLVGVGGGGGLFGAPGALRFGRSGQVAPDVPVRLGVDPVTRRQVVVAGVGVALVQAVVGEFSVVVHVVRDVDLLEQHAVLAIDPCLFQLHLQCAVLNGFLWRLGLF